MKRQNQLWMWHYINKILYYNKTYYFLQIIVTIIINYYYIIYKLLNNFARENAVSKVYKYMPSDDILCKANLYSDFMVPQNGQRSCRQDMRVCFVNFLR